MIDQFRRDAEAFLDRRMQALYLASVGTGSDPELHTLHAEFSDLWREQTIAGLKDALREVPDFLPSRRKSVRRLLGFALRGHLLGRTRSLDVEIDRVRTRAEILWNGESLTLDRALDRLAREPEHQLRLKLHDEVLAALGSVRGERLERREKLREAAAGLGYPSLREAWLAMTGIDWAELAQAARRFLESTRRVYEHQFAAAMHRELQLGPREAHAADIAALQGTQGSYPAFAAAERTRAWSGTLDRLGLDAFQIGSLRIQVLEGAEGPGRARCYPLRVPAEVVLLLEPGGGPGAFRSLLGEGARSLLYAGTSGSLPVEHRRCGDASLGRAYARLFESLTGEMPWLLGCLGWDGGTEFTKKQAFLALMEARLDAVRCLFCDDWLSAGPASGDSLAARFAEIVSGNMLWRCEESLWLMEGDMIPDAAGRFRSALLGAQLREYLLSRYSRAWYNERRAGRFLRELWDTGELYDCPELGRELGFASEDPDLLAHLLCEVLNSEHY